MCKDSVMFALKAVGIICATAEWHEQEKAV